MLQRNSSRDQTTLSSDEAELLAQSDLKLFDGGGCHIFAAELHEDLEQFEFALRMIADVKGDWRSQALHVFLGKGELMVDVHGTRKQTDVLCEWTQFRSSQHGPPFQYDVFPCSYDELFKRYANKNDDLGIVNKFNHRIGEHFVQECRRRARAMIASSPEEYLPPD
jgi:hypothetical protein